MAKQLRTIPSGAFRSFINAYKLTFGDDVKLNSLKIKAINKYNLSDEEVMRVDNWAKKKLSLYHEL